MEDFSVVAIARNEAEMLPRLVESLAGVDDIVVLDTGSIDNTAEVARELGCNVVEVGDKFRLKPTAEHFMWWEHHFDWEPSFEKDVGYFHFSEARNYASQFAKNDWIFCPDADEIVCWDLEKVREAIQEEDHLVYRFCYQHQQPNPECDDWSCALEFTHSKFFRRSKLQWVNWVHEVHAPLPGESPRPPKYVDFIYHHHWQNQGTGRGNYLPGLELDVIQGMSKSQADPRNTYYLAREYMYAQRYDHAIRVFDIAISIASWQPEKAQAYIYQGNCYRRTDRHWRALDCYHNALRTHSGRREPFWELATLYDELGHPHEAITYLEAAMSIPFRQHGYLNDMTLYGWIVPDRLAMLYHKHGPEEQSRRWWREALRHKPTGEVLSNVSWFYRGDLPLVSICVPAVREEGYARLVKSIHDNTVYPNWEILSDFDPGDTAVIKFNRLVDQAKGDMIVYLADDTEVRQGWLTQAFVYYRERLGKTPGLVILNDGYWKGKMANHFLCDRRIKDLLDGEIWHSGYHHWGVDNELYGRLKEWDLVDFCAEAEIVHHHPHTPTAGAARLADEHDQKIVPFINEDRHLLYSRQKALNFGPRVAVFCTTYNEADRIQEFVSSNLNYAHAIYISDNGSTDGTPNIAARAGALVHQSGLVHTPDDYNEGRTKQAALEFAMTGNYDWYLYLDADEILAPEAEWLLPEMINNESFDAYGMQRWTFWMDREHVRTDGDFSLYDMTQQFPLRMWRPGACTFSIPEKGKHSHPIYRGGSYADSGVRIFHYGFPDRETALRKYNTYVKADPDGKMSDMAKSYAHLHPDYDKAALFSINAAYPALDDIMDGPCLVFDIGARFGEYTNIFKGYGATVVAVEPNPETVHRIDNDIVVQKAVLDHNGKTTLYLPNVNAHGWDAIATTLEEHKDVQGYRHIFSEGRSVEVETTTLDDLIEEYGEPYFIKIDVEGAEEKVINGLSYGPKYLSFEAQNWHLDETDRCIDRILELGGYEFNFTFGDSWYFRSVWTDRGDVMRYIRSTVRGGMPLYWNIYARRVSE